MTETVLDIPTLTLGEEIDRLWEFDQRLKKLGKALDEEKAVCEQLKERLFARLESEGATGARGKKASVSIGDPVTCANVENWDAFYGYIHRNKAYHLLQRRPTNAAYAELLIARKGKPVPGVVPFEKRNLNMRTV